METTPGMAKKLAIEITKSSRHSKITGDFGEHMTLYLLSKHGFECALVDHTGMDIIARDHKKLKRTMGISVKSRSRDALHAEESLLVPKDNFDKLTQACNWFDCDPYFSFVVDRHDKLSVYIVPLDVLRSELYPKTNGGLNWSMTPAAVKKYADNRSVYRWELTHSVESWWPGSIEPGSAA